jgi:oxaloacetate decarboxylase gamma subunit
MENLNEALGLLAVGMLTVFSILLIVIFLGKALIAIINKVAPAEEPKKAVKVAAAPAAVSAKTQSIIQAAVSQLTGGKGKVAKITKL